MMAGYEKHADQKRVQIQHVTPVRKKIDLVRIGSLYPDQLKAFPSISYI